MSATYRAAIMDAETGGNHSYEFRAAPDLFRMPAHDIVDAFICSLDGYGDTPAPLAYELNSAVKNHANNVVMAMGSLIVGRGEIPFLVMISPDGSEASAE